MAFSRKRSSEVANGSSLEEASPPSKRRRRFGVARNVQPPPPESLAEVLELEIPRYSLTTPSLRELLHPDNQDLIVVVAGSRLTKGARDPLRVPYSGTLSDRMIEFLLHVHRQSQRAGPIFRREVLASKEAIFDLRNPCPSRALLRFLDDKIVQSPTSAMCVLRQLAERSLELDSWDDLYRELERRAAVSLFAHAGYDRTHIARELSATTRQHVEPVVAARFGGDYADGGEEPDPPLTFLDTTMMALLASPYVVAKLRLWRRPLLENAKPRPLTILAHWISFAGPVLPMGPLVDPRQAQRRREEAPSPSSFAVAVDNPNLPPLADDDYEEYEYNMDTGPPPPSRRDGRKNHNYSPQEVLTALERKLRKIPPTYWNGLLPRRVAAFVGAVCGVAGVPYVSKKLLVHVTRTYLNFRRACQEINACCNEEEDNPELLMRRAAWGVSLVRPALQPSLRRKRVGLPTVDDAPLDGCIVDLVGGAPLTLHAVLAIQREARRMAPLTKALLRQLLQRLPCATLAAGALAALEPTDPDEIRALAQTRVPALDIYADDRRRPDDPAASSAQTSGRA